MDIYICLIGGSLLYALRSSLAFINTYFIPVDKLLTVSRVLGYGNLILDRALCHIGRVLLYVLRLSPALSTEYSIPVYKLFIAS